MSGSNNTDIISTGDIVPVSNGPAPDAIEDSEEEQSEEQAPAAGSVQPETPDDHEVAPEEPEVSESDTSQENSEDSPEQETEPEVESESEPETEAEDDNLEEQDGEEESDPSVSEEASEEEEQQSESASTEDEIVGFSGRINAGLLRDELVGAVGSLVNEARFHTSPDGVEAKVVDPANVAFTSPTLGCSAFEDFSAGNHTLGVNINRTKEVLGQFKASQDISFEVTEQNQLKLADENLEFNISLIDPDTIRQEPDLPELDLPVTATIDSDELKRAIKAADLVSDYIYLKSDGDSLLIGAWGDTDDVELELEDEDDGLLDFTSQKDVRSLFSLDYVKDINKGLTPDEITIRFGDDFPLVIEGETADGEGTTLFMLAPRIES